MLVAPVLGGDVFDALVDLPEQVLVRRELLLLPIVHCPHHARSGRSRIGVPGLGNRSPREVADGVAFDKTQAFIRATALCQMLLAELERIDEREFASEEFIAELRQLCERGRTELSSSGPGGA